jgi:hypothetical protein
VLLTPHVAVGIAIGAALPNPVISVPLAFLSHYLLDMVPHWDDVGLGEIEMAHPLNLKTRTFRLILLDALFSISLLLFFLYWSMPDYGVGITIAAGAAAAALPDLFYLPLIFWGKKWRWAIWLARLQAKLQVNSKAPLAFGLSIQFFAVVVGSLIARQEILIQLPQIWRIL